MKKYLLGIIVLATVITAGVYLWPKSAADVSVVVPIVAADSQIAIFVQPQAGQAPLVDEIARAKKEILVEVYLLSDEKVLSALEAAASRGVIVKVMMEQHPFGGGNINQHTAQLLKNTRVQVKWTNPQFALTHEKTMTIDGQETFILNQNLTTAAFEKNREYDVIDTNPADVAEVKAIFEADWERKSHQHTSSHLLVSPINSRATLEMLIQGATKTIDIEMEVIDDTEIEKLLDDKAKNTQVRIIIPDFVKVPSNAAAARRLQLAGIQVRTLKNPYLHAKLVMIDQHKAYIGSINFTTQSMDKNREVGIIISESKSLTDLAINFDNDWMMSE